MPWEIAMSGGIEVEDLRKVFRVRTRPAGFRAALEQLVRPQEREVAALDGLSFSIAPGERVAFVGPNGAGKSTTLKVLSGILRPSSGRATVAGHVPWQEREKVAYRIGTVFGQRSQLWYHLPAAETFELLARVYDQDVAVYRRRRDALVEAFDLAELLERPVRQLSLGQRMRCEIAASLLHVPEILFLDEPTIGLDVSAKAIVRDLVREASLRDGSSVLLTSHDTGDMERVCERVIVIHEGRLLLDQPVQRLRSIFLRRKIVTLHTAEEAAPIALPGVATLFRDRHCSRLEVDVALTPIEVVVRAALGAARELRDLSVEDPPLEAVVQAIYAEAARTSGRSAP
jgi:ABC-2 type transport system ATP-binding protein